MAAAAAARTMFEKVWTAHEVVAETTSIAERLGDAARSNAAALEQLARMSERYDDAARRVN